MKKTRAYIRADLPEELLNAWLQHLRDFDVANPGCYFDICVDGPDMPMREMVDALRVNPKLKFEHFFERAREGQIVGGDDREEHRERTSPLASVFFAASLEQRQRDDKRRARAIWSCGACGGHFDYGRIEGEVPNFCPYCRSSRLAKVCPVNPPADKNFPPDAGQCDPCGGWGCSTCGGKGWLASDHEKVRHCEREGCSNVIPPDFLAVYCSSMCAQSDAS